MARRRIVYSVTAAANRCEGRLSKLNYYQDVIIIIIIIVVTVVALYRADYKPEQGRG